MGKIILTLRTSPTDVFKGDITIADNQVTRIINAYRGLYYPNGVLVTPADPTATPPVAEVRRPATDQEVVLKIADGISAGLRANAKRSEQDAASATAAAAITDLPADPAVP